MINDMNLGANSKQVARANLLHELTGIPLSPMLPLANAQMLSAEEIGNQLNVSSQLVGRIVTELGIRNNPELFEARQGKAKHNNKDIVQNFYSPAVVEMIKQKLNERKSA